MRMWRLLLVAVAGALAESSNALRGQTYYRHQWDEEWSRRIQITDERKHKKTDSPTVSPAPSISPQPSASPTVSPAPSSSPTSAPSTSPTSAPSPIPSSSPTSAPSTTPTSAPSPIPSSGPSSKPSSIPSISNQPSPSPTTAEQKAACEAAAKSDVFVTEAAVTVRFLYELLSPANSNIMQVASHVDEKVQDFLVDTMIDCGAELSTVGGVGPGEIDTVVESVCSKLVTGDLEVCHLMEGTVVLYLTTGATLTDEEGLEHVSQELSIAFNGACRSLQSNGVSVRSLFIDPDLGILGLYYIGGRVEEDKPGTSDTGTAKSSIPAIVVPIVVVAFIALVVIALLVFRRRKDKDQLRGLLLAGDDNTISSPEERWKEMDEPPLRSKVVTTDEEDSSYSSGSRGDDALVAANDVVMADLSGYTVSDSIELSEDPVFVNPNEPTYYKVSSTKHVYQVRQYAVGNTVDI